mgnify:CR=1 FL=1
MILRTSQSMRNRIAVTDERSDQVRPGELEVYAGGGVDGDTHHAERRLSGVCPRESMDALAGSIPARQHQLLAVSHNEGADKSDVVKVTGMVDGGDRMLLRHRGNSQDSITPKSAGPAHDWRAQVSVSSVPALAECPICHGPTSSLTGGACATCRRKMDAAMDEQMKQLAEDREFQRELEEALEQLDAMPPQKLRYCECCKEPFHDDYRSVCPRHHCQLWLEGEKYRRWNAELEQSIKESIHG